MARRMTLIGSTASGMDLTRSTSTRQPFALRYPNLVNTKGNGVETDGNSTWLKYKTKRKPEVGQRQLLSLTHVIEPQPELKKQRQTKISEFSSKR